MRYVMITQRFLFLVLSVILLGHALADYSHADSAAVLPRGSWQIFTESRIFADIGEFYNNEGDKTPLGAPFSIPLAPVFGAGPPLDFGTSQVTITNHVKELEFIPAFGLTNKLSLGLIIPYTPEFNTDFSFTNNTATANFGFISGTLTPCPLAGGPPCAPADLNSVNAALATLGFKPLGNRTRSGVGNIKVGGRYQYFDAEHFRAAFTGGVILPTGDEHDPDDLLFVPIGFHAWGLFFEFQQDLLFQQPGLGRTLGYPVPGDFFLNATVKYDLSLPDSDTFRVCATPPFCPASSKVELDRNLGDVIKVELQPTVGVLKGVLLGGRYRYTYVTKTEFSGGPPGIPVDTLEANTEEQAHEWRITLTLTSIPWVIEKKFPLPFAFNLSYRDRFAGDNGPFVSQYTGFDFVFYGFSEFLRGLAGGDDSRT